MPTTWIVGDAADGLMIYEDTVHWFTAPTAEDIKAGQYGADPHYYWYRSFLKFALAQIKGTVIEATCYIFCSQSNKQGTAPTVVQVKHITKDDADWFPRAALAEHDWDTTIATIDDAWIDGNDDVVVYFNFICTDEVEADRLAGKDWFAAMLKGTPEDTDLLNSIQFVFWANETTTEGTRPDGNAGTLVPMLKVVWTPAMAGSPVVPAVVALDLI